MVFWSAVFILISIALLIGNLFNIPQEAYYFYPIMTLLGALGLLYRTLYKIHKAEKENYLLEISRLKSELDDYKRKMVRGETEIITKYER